VPIPSCRRFPSDGQLIARNHLDLHAHLPGARDGCLGLLAWRIEQWQHAKKLPLAFLIRPRHAQGTEAAPANSLTAFSTAGFTCRHWSTSPESPAARPWPRKTVFRPPFDGGFGALMHRVEGLEMDHLIAFKALIVFQAPDHGQSMVSLSSAREASAAQRMT
jgi:hypothetical protein